MLTSSDTLLSLCYLNWEKLSNHVRVLFFPWTHFICFFGGGMGLPNPFVRLILCGRGLDLRSKTVTIPRQSVLEQFFSNLRWRKFSNLSEGEGLDAELSNYKYPFDWTLAVLQICGIQGNWESDYPFGPVLPIKCSCGEMSRSLLRVESIWTRG
jgi:hypothetical protein